MTLTPATPATAAPPLLFGAGPPPRLVPGSGDHQPPRVPEVIQFGEPATAYSVPALTRLTVLYHTPTTVRVQAEGGAASLQPAQVGALPDEAAWTAAQAVSRQYQTTLDALAAALRELGRYDTRLGAAAAWVAAQAEPLCPTVIEAKDPASRSWSHWGPRGKPPTVLRHAVDRQTPKMLHLTSSGVSSAALSAQSQYFVCPTDDDWTRVDALHNAVRATAAAWLAFMTRLGTYSDPLPQGPLPPSDPALLATNAPPPAAPDTTTPTDPAEPPPADTADPAPPDAAAQPAIAPPNAADPPPPEVTDPAPPDAPAQPAPAPADTTDPTAAGATEDFDLGDDAAPGTAPPAEQDADAAERGDDGAAGAGGAVAEAAADGAGAPTALRDPPPADGPARPTTTDVTGAVVRLTLVLQPSSGPPDERPVLLIAHTAQTTPVVQQVRWGELAPWPAVLTALLDTLAAQPPRVAQPPTVTSNPTTTPPAGRHGAARTPAPPAPPAPTLPAVAPPAVHQLTLFDP